MPLGYDVFVADPVPLQVNEQVPNGEPRRFSPLSVTLIHGDRDAVLVDPPLTRAQAEEVAGPDSEKRQEPHRHIRHPGHGDHWFTAGMLAERFDAQVVATAGTIEQMQANVAIRAVSLGQVVARPDPRRARHRLTVPDGNRLDLEGHELLIVEVGHSDTDETSVLHVPDLDLVVAGDVIYTASTMSSSRAQGRWHRRVARAIDIVESLRPRFIVCRPQEQGTSTTTRSAPSPRPAAYLDTVDELLAEHETALGFFDAMLERFPALLNPGALWEAPSPSALTKDPPMTTTYAADQAERSAGGFLHYGLRVAWTANRF